MARATLIIHALDIFCPHCEQVLAEPDSGSLFWTMEEVEAFKSKYDKILCMNCHGECFLTIPKIMKT